MQSHIFLLIHLVTSSNSYQLYSKWSLIIASSKCFQCSSLANYTPNKYPLPKIDQKQENIPNKSRITQHKNMMQYESNYES